MIIHYITLTIIDTPRTAQEIRLARIKYGLKQEDLAKAILVSRSYIAQLENGLRDISEQTAQKLKEYFDSYSQDNPQQSIPDGIS